MTSANPEASAGPSARPTRLPTLDVLRGIAILGTFASNVWLFTISVGSEGEPGKYSLESIIPWVPNGKFLAMLTLLFGVGIAIQQQAARRAGRAWPGTYLVRCVILFIDGLINYYFVITFDVLRVYAVVAFVVAFLLLFSDRLQWLWATAFAAIHLWSLWNIATEPVTAVATRRVDIPATPVDDSPPPGPPSWIDDVRFNFQQFHLGFDITSELRTLPLFVAALFLIGGLLYRRGIFDSRGRRLRYAAIVIGFGICLPADFIVSVVLREGWSPFGRYFFATGTGLAIIAAISEFYLRRHRVGVVGTALSLVGRMALTCYLLQNILGVLAEQTVLRSHVFFYADATLVTIALWGIVSLLLIGFCWGWLRFFDRGPMELLWQWVFRAITKRRSA